MSKFSNIMSNIFNNPTADQVPAPVAPTNPGNIPDQATPATKATSGTEANGVVPAADSPMAKYKDVWEPNPVDPNAPKPPTGAEPLKPEDVAKAVSSANFTGSITPEQLAAVTAGGEGAQAALLEMLNATSQQTLAQATMVNDKLTAKAVEQAIKAAESKIPELLRQQSISNHMKDANPVFSNPAIKPVIDATRQQLAQKNPNASAAQITEMTQEFIMAMGEAFMPKQDANAVEPGETDWTKFLS